MDGTAEELFVPMLHLGLRANGIALPTIGNIGMVGHIPDVARPGTERCPTTGRNTLGPDGIAMRPNLGGRHKVTLPNPFAVSLLLVASLPAEAPLEHNFRYPRIREHSVMGGAIALGHRARTF